MSDKFITKAHKRLKKEIAVVKRPKPPRRGPKPTLHDKIKKFRKPMVGILQEITAMESSHIPNVKGELEDLLHTSNPITDIAAMLSFVKDLEKSCKRLLKFAEEIK